MPKPNPAFEIHRVLQLCSEMEREMAELYRDFARLHARDADLARLWQKTASEEDNHASQFRLAQSYEGEIGATVVTSDQAQGLLNVAREMRRRCRENPPGPENALRIAIELEKRFDEYHASTIGAFRTPQTGRLFQAMRDADRSHSEALEAALAARSAD